jgi:hypothetical protein
MSCERCEGLMVIETICEFMEGTFRRGINMTRCLNCGNFEDTRILTNRVTSRVSRQVETRTVESRRLSAIQARALERVIPALGVMTKSLRGRAPSDKTRRLEPEHLE